MNSEASLGHNRKSSRCRDHSTISSSPVFEQDDGVEVLILNQPSSIEAMNVARMLSPRFAETINYSPDITKNSADDVRVKTLLQSDRIGSYYR
ncbi:hypothetical protein DYB32_000065 [Aphanomyces invadans]|uniref:Uncharacterized protein n=1 Tax=Aphanomyces invadans TaxID=157072 RepID=A0A3R6Z6G5_9STRA|nr:hypothetical protein DYB32_000065 [Aphanomyces invadans]